MDFGTLWPYASFVLGSLFALLLQRVAYGLALKKDQRKEYWIRVLNSYQDFYQQTTQLIDLVRSDVQIPKEVYWTSMSLARKAAFDASFFDTTHPERTERMKVITTQLLRTLQGESKDMLSLDQLEREIKDLRNQFLSESGHTLQPGGRIRRLTAGGG